MPDLGSIRPWEMEDFTPAEVEVLRAMVKEIEREAKAHRRG